uniref:NADH dehydrogenase subunit 5 n=1 Tax=Stheneboea repudiosa TaxID=2779127 RepID=UPI0025AA2FE7|nr:NADH dehydrogenase subunit 5 [Stheneboea repudiosa]WID87127.1 NADH dehydrogenase subunit 5 [Stheneboea repudiosa]
MLFNYCLCSILLIYLFFISFVLFMLGIYFITNDLVYFIEYELFMMSGSQFIMTFLFDWMSLIFVSFVFFISSLVIYYSKDYMKGDVFFDRFIILVLMFVFSMMFLILSPNLISILLGWDGLGLISYCLVIYYQNVKSFNAGMITALSNRVGDTMLLISIAWMFNYGSWNYFMYIDFFNIEFDVILISLMIVIAGMTSSAQIPFSPWLPAAMAAPTPVSSLVHSSTLVTAGVYLLIRLHPLYLSVSVSKILLIVSLITMFMSGFCANFEFDLSKIIALSTLSQLGLMMSILSFGYFDLAYFHMLTHALFKASLFMCSGVIIHNFVGCQDIRYLGNLLFQMPLTMVCVIIATLCLCGIPFLSGFYSKDLILEMYSMSYINVICYLFFYFSIGLTVSYSFRLIFYLIISDFCFYSFHSVNDENLIMLSSVFFMIMFSLFGGSMLSWFLFPSPMFIFMPLILKLMVVFMFILGASVGFLLSLFNSINYLLGLFYYSLYSYFGSMWFMPYISIKSIYFPLFLGLKFNISCDYGWIEFYGGQGVSLIFVILSLFNQKVQNSVFNLFFIIIFFWFIFMIFI